MENNSYSQVRGVLATISATTGGWVLLFCLIGVSFLIGNTETLYYGKVNNSFSVGLGHAIVFNTFVVGTMLAAITQWRAGEVKVGLMGVVANVLVFIYNVFLLASLIPEAFVSDPTKYVHYTNSFILLNSVRLGLEVSFFVMNYTPKSNKYTIEEIDDANSVSTDWLSAVKGKLGFRMAN